MFDRASLYEAAAKKYAVFGIWGKAIEYAYKAISFQLKVSKEDPSEILKLNDFFQTTEFQEGFVSGICSHLYFIAKKIRRESDKDYTYFLKQLLTIAQRNNDARVITILHQRIMNGDKGSVSFE